MTHEQFRHRIASQADIPNLIELMRLSIDVNMREFLTPAEIEATKESMGLDHSLIDDGTYFIIETGPKENPIIVACGGWGKRRTLYGGDQTVGRDDTLSDPNKDAARIRAMYTHPDWTRKGLGSMLLLLGETAARKAGFKTIELGATIPGKPLYDARGYEAYFTEETLGQNGEVNTVIHMRKAL